MNNNEKILKGIIEDLMKCIGNNDLFEKPILVDLDKLEIKSISKNEISDLFDKIQVAKSNEIVVDSLKEYYKNKDMHFENEEVCKEKVEQEELKDDINPFENGVNVEIEEDTEVLIYLPYENKDDLFEKMLELIDIFDEDIINNIFVDTDEKLIKVEIYELITQNEIFDILSTFGDKNTKVNTAGDALWIIIDDCI